MTRRERDQLLAITIGLRLGHVQRSLELLRELIDIADAEHDREDQVNASLVSNEGNGDGRDRSV